MFSENVIENSDENCCHFYIIFLLVKHELICKEWDEQTRHFMDFTKTYYKKSAHREESRDF
jgi:hypothetical protein